MDLSDASIHKVNNRCGTLPMLTEAQSLRFTWMPIISSQVAKMEPLESGQEQTKSCSYSSMVSFIFSFIIYVDQKKDIVSLFPDINQPHLIHSCSMDRTLSTYDLKQEKRMLGHQTQNGALYGMSQRKDNEFELVTCGQGAPIYFWDCDEAKPVA
jgi:hypothetical protein